MAKQWIGWTLVVCLTLRLGPDVCARTQEKTIYKNVLIAKVPHVLQKPDVCGEACAEIYLRKLGKDIEQDYVFEQLGVDPLRARGCFTTELTKALEPLTK